MESILLSKIRSSTQSVYEVSETGEGGLTDIEKQTERQPKKSPKNKLIWNLTIIIILIVAFILAFFLLKLLGTLEKNFTVSNTMRQIAMNSIEIADMYINGEMSGEDAYQRIEEYSHQAEDMWDSVSNEDDYRYQDDFGVKIRINALEQSIYGCASKYFGTSTMQDVREDRDDLAECIGKRKKYN